jgi:hypothetical protein
MPFKPGQSGNPAGRRVKSEAVREVEALAREYAPEAVNKLAEWMRSDNAKASVAASNALLDRGLGKPTQALEHSGPDGEALVITWQPQS